MAEWPVRGDLPWGAKVKAYIDDTFLSLTSRAKNAPALGLYFPEAQGAVGDGTADDNAAMAATFTLARAAKGRVLLQANKTYTVTATLNPAGTIVDGFASTVKIKAGVTANFNVFTSNGPCTIEGLTIDLNKANTVNPNVNSQGIGFYQFVAGGWSGRTVLRDVSVINGHQIGVRFGTTSAATDPLDAALNDSAAVIENLRVDGCNVGVWLQNTAGITLINPRITNIGTDGIWDYFSRGTQIIGGRVTATGNHGVVTQYSHGFLASGVDVHAAGSMGIVVGGGSTTLESARDFRITGCHVRSCVSHGISVDPTKVGAPTTIQPCDGSITGNVMYGNGMHGIYLHNTSRVGVSGNVCTNHVGASAGALVMDSALVSVSGNTFTGNTYGIKFTGNVAGYGYHAVGENVVRNNVTADWYYDANGAAVMTLSLTGAGVPAIPAPVGSLYRRTDGGAGSSLYVKESGGVTSAGWVAK